MSTYVLTLAIEAEELAEYLDCKVDEIENHDYFGAIRDYGEIVSLKVEGQDG